MKETLSNDVTTALIRNLPNLPKTRLVELWKENFGREPGRIRPELMLPILAYRIQERAYGGLSPNANARSQIIATCLRPQSRFRNEAKQRFKSGTKLIREWKGETRSPFTTTAITIEERLTRLSLRSHVKSPGPAGPGPPFSVRRG
jgi:Protein of unknown function (DUF2924)